MIIALRVFTIVGCFSFRPCAEKKRRGKSHEDSRFGYTDSLGSLYGTAELNRALNNLRGFANCEDAEDLPPKFLSCLNFFRVNMREMCGMIQLECSRVVP